MDAFYHIFPCILRRQKLPGYPVSSCTASGISIILALSDLFLLPQSVTRIITVSILFPRRERDMHTTTVGLYPLLFSQVQFDSLSVADDSALHV